MKCFKCGAMLPDGTKFCVMCGTNLMAQTPKPQQAGTMNCPKCGFPSPSGAGFCKFCGYRLMTPINTDGFAAQEPRCTLINMDKYIGDRGIGFSESSGILKIYEDRIEFDPSQGKAGSFIGKAFSKKKNSEGKTLETYSMSTIRACCFSKFMSSIPAILIELSDGTMIKFARSARANETKDAVTLINQLITPSVPASAPQQTVSSSDTYDKYSFVMEISNYIAVDEQYIAIIGSVVKGNVSKGTTLYVTGKDGSTKGSFEIKSIAVNKTLAGSAFQGCSDTAFLCSFPGYLLKYGDICTA